MTTSTAAAASSAAVAQSRCFSKRSEPVDDQTVDINFVDEDEERRKLREEANARKHDNDNNMDRSLFTVPIIIRMPDMGDKYDKSTIEKWYKQPGDVVKRDDIICDIATPDFTFGMMTDDECDAILDEIHVSEGETAEDNAPICTVLHPRNEEEGEEDGVVKEDKAGGEAKGAKV